jgi:putative hemolysin
LREIGRLREISFRQAGEGTGSSIDLDEFDSRYYQLFIWNRARNEIAGAYRLAGTDDIVSRYGKNGLYTNTLFRFSPYFFNRIHPALELGRSFVRPEYQRSYLPLLLLWKGIGHFVARRPWYRVLFGPVSISASYTTQSQSLMVDFLELNRPDLSLAFSVKPRHRFRSNSPRWSKIRNLAALLPDIDELSEAVMDLEPDRKGVPVLVRQYAALGGQILAFNVDHAFSGALDGLVVVDLEKVNLKLLERYMGKAGAAMYLARHQTGAA